LLQIKNTISGSEPGRVHFMHRDHIGADNPTSLMHIWGHIWGQSQNQ